MLLSAITGLLVVMLVSIFAVSARGAFERQQEAARVLSVIGIEREMLTAKEDIRAELGAVNAALETPEGESPESASARGIENIVALHAKTEAAFALLSNALALPSANRTGAALTRIQKSRAI